MRASSAQEKLLIERRWLLLETFPGCQCLPRGLGHLEIQSAKIRTRKGAETLQKRQEEEHEAPPRDG